MRLDLKPADVTLLYGLTLNRHAGGAQSADQRTRFKCWKACWPVWRVKQPNCGACSPDEFGARAAGRAGNASLVDGAEGLREVRAALRK